MSTPSKRRVTVPAYLAQHAGKTGGTYVIVTKDQHWGRGDTLEEAIANARKAGARSFNVASVVLAWQPDSAWQEILAGQRAADPTGNDQIGYLEGGSRRDAASKPYVGNDGSVYHWGWQGETLVYLHRPSMVKPGSGR